ncbi:MAG: response regulator [Chloroflexi bacterium]|nr:response regulator [Chloroflexota bacterium]
MLVIDDNADLVHFYRRYTTGTRYQIVHLAEGQHTLSTVKEIRPNIIILDVMLPDIDGWELLTDLRGQPATQMIPIIVCSVVRRAELALSLGASLYLPKPVRRREFVQALDQILNQRQLGLAGRVLRWDDNGWNVFDRLILLFAG